MTTPTQNPTHAATSSHTAAMAPTQTWKTWPDWVNLILGAYLTFAATWTLGAPGGWFVTLGLIVAAVSLWALATASSPASEWVQIVVGAVVFLAPWLGGFAAATAAAWTMWIVGLAVIVFAAIGLATSPSRQIAR